MHRVIELSTGKQGIPESGQSSEDEGWALQVGCGSSQPQRLLARHESIGVRDEGFRCEAASLGRALRIG